MVSDWGGRDRIGGILPRLGVLNQGDIVRIGIYCPDWGYKWSQIEGGVVRIGDILSGLRVA